MDSTTSTPPDVSNSINEDAALALLTRHDLTPQQFDQLAKTAARNRKVKLALVEHPQTPRHISLPTVRHLYTFDLMQVALTPATPADVKKAAEETLIHRLDTITEGEKLTLAHRSSGSVAGALLLDPQSRVILAALENPRLTEASVIKAVATEACSLELIHALCRHPKWSLRREVRTALLRSAHTPATYAVEFARALPSAFLAELLRASRLPEDIKNQILSTLR